MPQDHTQFLVHLAEGEPKSTQNDLGAKSPGMVQLRDQVLWQETLIVFFLASGREIKWLQDTAKKFCRDHLPTSWARRSPPKQERAHQCRWEGSDLKINSFGPQEKETSLWGQLQKEGPLSPP